LNQFSASAKISIANLESFTSSINTVIKTKLDLDGVISGAAQITIGDLDGFADYNDSIMGDINGKEEIASATHTLISGSSQIVSLLPAGVISGSSQLLGGTGIVSGSSQIVPLLPLGVISGSSQILGGSGLFSSSVQIGNYVGTIAGTENQVVVAGSGLNNASVTLSTPQNIHTSATPQFSSLGIGTAASGVGGEIRATGDIVAFYSSDERLKSNIQPIGDALTKVNQISGNVYDWKEGFEDIHSHTGTDIGVIAQEIEKVLPQAVIDRESGYKAVNYEKIIPLLIEAIKELSLKVKELENK
jgi:hypothetical protein